MIVILCLMETYGIETQLVELPKAATINNMATYTELAKQANMNLFI